MYDMPDHAHVISRDIGASHEFADSCTDWHVASYSHTELSGIHTSPHAWYPLGIEGIVALQLPSQMIVHVFVSPQAFAAPVHTVLYPSLMMAVSHYKYHRTI
jgi:hypothetical protein